MMSNLGKNGYIKSKSCIYLKLDKNVLCYEVGSYKGIIPDKNKKYETTDNILIKITPVQFNNLFKADQTLNDNELEDKNLIKNAILKITSYRGHTCSQKLMYIDYYIFYTYIRLYVYI